MNVIAGTVEGHEVAAVKNGHRAVRTYLVTQTGGATLVQCRDATGIPTMGSVDPELAGAYLIYKVARAVAPGVARVYCHYETPTITSGGGGGGGGIETFAASDDTGQTGSITEIHPFDSHQLLVFNGGSAVASQAHQTASISYPKSLRRLTYRGLFADRPSSAVRRLVNHVNDRSYQEYPAGYWLCDHVSSSYSSRDGLYQVTVSMVTQQEEPWWSYWIANGPDGKHVTIPPKVLRDSRTKVYEYKTVNNTYGFLQTGLYPVADFQSVLGM